MTRINRFRRGELTEVTALSKRLISFNRNDA